MLSPSPGTSLGYVSCGDRLVAFCPSRPHPENRVAPLVSTDTRPSTAPRGSWRFLSAPVRGAQDVSHAWTVQTGNDRARAIADGFNAAGRCNQWFVQFALPPFLRVDRDII